MLILLGLAVLWTALLLPPIIRRTRRSASPRPIAALSASSRLDARGLRVIQRVAVSVPGDPGSARRRRRDVFFALAGGAIGTSDLAPLAFIAGVVLVVLGTALGLGAIRGFTPGG